MWGRWPAINSATSTPSSSALWANMAPLITSPIAKTFAADVLRFSSTSIRPLSSQDTPMASKPKPAVNGLRPTATKQMSTSCWISFPF